jgi:hypothetical protein
VSDISCSNCSGSGDCPACGGSGEGSYNTHPSPSYVDSETGDVDCVACDGSGTCSECGGSGEE